MFERFSRKTAESEAEACAWQRCYRELGPKLLLFARQWLPSQADAEDAVQTAFVRFWRKHPGADEAHYALLYAAVRTAALDMLKASERRTRRETAALGPDGRGGEGALFFETPLVKQEMAQTVQAALERLPAEQREALVLRIWGELTFAEIARALDESINTVSARYRYALQALRKHLHPQEHEYERV